MQYLRKLLPEAAKAYYRGIRARLLSLNLRAEGPFSLPPEEVQATAALSVVVAVHDAPQVTARCLNSLERFGGESEVIIVDDGSRLQTTQQVLEEFCSRSRWRMIRNEKALGHSRASEIGVGVSARPYVCLLNSDTVITPRSWAGVIGAFEAFEEIGIAGPVTSHTPSRQRLARASRCRHYWSDEQIWCFAESYVARNRCVPLVDVSFVGGFAFFVRRTLWESLRGFDANLVDYGNESELCRRAAASDVRIVYTKESYIHHLGSESYGRTIGHEEIRKRRLDGRAFVEQRYGTGA